MIQQIGPAAAAGQNIGGLDFTSMLRIVLSQLTFQDPLKPMDNFQFVSQLAQFSQLLQSQTLNEQVTSLLAAQGATQATGLLGRAVDFDAGQGILTGTVKSVSFTSGSPLLAVETTAGQTVANVSLADITQVR